MAKNVVRNGTGLLAHSVLHYTVLLDIKHPRGTFCVNSNFIINVSLYVSYFSSISMRDGPELAQEFWTEIVVQGKKNRSVSENSRLFNC